MVPMDHPESIFMIIDGLFRGRIQPDDLEADVFFHAESQQVSFGREASELLGLWPFPSLRSTSPTSASAQAKRPAHAPCFGKGK